MSMLNRENRTKGENKKMKTKKLSVKTFKGIELPSGLNPYDLNAMTKKILTAFSKRSMVYVQMDDSPESYWAKVQIKSICDSAGIEFHNLNTYAYVIFDCYKFKV